MNIQDSRQIAACEKDPKCSVPYHQPGSAGGYPPFSKSPLKSCPEMTARIRGENPTVSTTTFEGLCPFGTSKIALAVDPNEDYHFWRQDQTGWWSGKPGSMKVTDKDASGRRVYDPSLADRDFTDDNGELNYTNFCSFYCVPRNRPLFMKTGGRRRTKKINGYKGGEHNNNRAHFYAAGSKVYPVTTRRYRGPK